MLLLHMFRTRHRFKAIRLSPIRDNLHFSVRYQSTVESDLTCMIEELKNLRKEDGMHMSVFSWCGCIQTVLFSDYRSKSHDYLLFRKAEWSEECQIRFDHPLRHSSTRAIDSNISLFQYISQRPGGKVPSMDGWGK